MTNNTNPTTDLTINSADLNEDYLDNPTGKELNFITRPVEMVKAKLRRTPMGAEKIMLYASLMCLALVALSVPIFMVAWVALPRGDTDVSIMTFIRLALAFAIGLVGVAVFVIGLAGMPIGWLFGKAHDGVRWVKTRNQAA